MRTHLSKMRKGVCARDSSTAPISIEKSEREKGETRKCGARDPPKATASGGILSPSVKTKSLLSNRFFLPFLCEEFSVLAFEVRVHSAQTFLIFSNAFQPSPPCPSLR